MRNHQGFGDFELGAAAARMMPLRASTSFGSAAASGLRNYINIETLKREKKPINKGFFMLRAMRLVRALRRASSRSPPTTSRAARRSSSPSTCVTPAATRSVRVPDAWRINTGHPRSYHKIFTRSPALPQRNTNSCPEKGSSASCVCTRCGESIEAVAHVSRARGPATPSLPQAVQSSLHQKIDHTRERFRIHTPAHHNAMTVAEPGGSLDEPRGSLRLRRTLTRRCRRCTLCRQHRRRCLPVTGSSFASSFAPCAIQ